MKEFSDTQRLNFLEKNECGVYPSYYVKRRYKTDGSNPPYEEVHELNGWVTSGMLYEKPTLREAIDETLSMDKIKPRKVVINTRIGGFGLSDECIKKYLTKKNIPFTENSTEYPGITIFETPTGFFSDSCFGSLERDDEVLIETIEEMGISAASGEYCELKIIEIPADIEWGLGMSDQGPEWIYEQHRTWE